MTDTCWSVAADMVARGSPLSEDCPAIVPRQAGVHPSQRWSRCVLWFNGQVAAGGTQDAFGRRCFQAGSLCPTRPHSKADITICHVCLTFVCAYAVSALLQSAPCCSAWHQAARERPTEPPNRVNTAEVPTIRSGQAPKAARRGAERPATLRKTGLRRPSCPPPTKPPSSPHSKRRNLACRRTSEAYQPEGLHHTLRELPDEVSQARGGTSETAEPEAPRGALAPRPSALGTSPAFPLLVLCDVPSEGALRVHPMAHGGRRCRLRSVFRSRDRSHGGLPDGAHWHGVGRQPAGTRPHGSEGGCPEHRRGACSVVGSARELPAGRPELGSP